jgi:hypothetical protein
VAEVQEVLDMAGHASILNRSLTWSPAGQGPEGRNLLVTVNARDGRSAVRVEERIALTGLWQAAPGVGGAAGAIFGGLLLGVRLGLEGPAVVIPALLCGMGCAYLAVRGVLTTRANVAEPQLVTLADRLARLIAGPGGAIAVGPAAALPPPGGGGRP